MFKIFISALKTLCHKTVNQTSCFIYFQQHILCRQLNLNIKSQKSILSHEDLNLLKISCMHSNFCSDSKEIHRLAESILSISSECVNSSKREDLVKTLSFLVSLGYSLKEIKEKSSSYFISTNSLFVKATQIAELDSNFLELLPFINLSVNALRRAAQQAKEDKHRIKGFPNRLAYLSHHLETPLEHLIPNLTKHASLLTMPFSRLNHKMLILKDAAICSEDLVKDLWIFNYSEKLMANRISTAEKVGVKLKPWMLRCSTKFFTSRLKKDFETHRILGSKDLVTYLSAKLNCKEEYVEYMMERNKLLKTINIPKIEKIITFLFDKGYTPQEIRIFPKVFCTSLETLSERFEEYCRAGCTLPPLPQLCLNSKLYLNKMGKHDN